LLVLDASFFASMRSSIVSAASSERIPVTSRGCGPPESRCHASNIVSSSRLWALTHSLNHEGTFTVVISSDLAMLYTRVYEAFNLGVGEFVSNLGVKWFETQGVSSSARGLARSQVRWTASNAHHGNLRFPKGPVASALIHI